MVNKKRKLFIDFKENFQKKTRLIEDLKILISNDLKLEEKESIFKNIRRKWINIGKVQKEHFELTDEFKISIKELYNLNNKWYYNY